MANEEQVALLKQGVEVWNQWRKENPYAEINLSGIDLSDANLIFANFLLANLSDANLRFANLQFADLRSADLRSADLQSANLVSADLRSANFCNVNLVSAHLNCANLRSTDFRSADFRSASLISANLGTANLLAANLVSADLSNVDLISANLISANLSDVNLRAAQALYTDFRRATLTGACIQDWQVGSSTNFEDVECRYIFRTYDPETEKFTGRLPVDPGRSFAPGEFEKWMQVRKGALDTIDITFGNGIDWQALFRSLQITRQQHPDVNVVVKSIEEEDGIFVARLRIETDVSGEAQEKLKAEVETQIKASYEPQLAGARGEIRALERSLDKALEKLAMTSKYNIHNFNGNFAESNFGKMTAHINQNNEAISQLIESLRTSAQTFPSEQKEDVLMELDDLEADLGKPEKNTPKRIGKRLQRLVAAGTAVASLAGGAATFSGNLNEFTENVLELGEKVGLSVEAIGTSFANEPE